MKSENDYGKSNNKTPPPAFSKTQFISQSAGSTAPASLRRQRSSLQNVSWDYFDRIRSSGTSRSRSPDLVDAIAVDNSTGTEQEIMLRHMPTFFPLIVEGKIKQNAFDSTAGTMLALYHFNSGIDTVNPHVASIVNEQKCNIRYTTEFFDTGYSEMQASRELANNVISRKYKDAPRDPKAPYATAIIGTFRSAVSATMSILGGVNELIQVSGSSTSAVLDNKGQYPFFARTVPASHANANAALDFLADVLGLTHFGILYVQDVAGQSYADSLKLAAVKKNPPLTVVASSIPYKENYSQAELDDALRPLIKSGFRYFFITVFENQYRYVMPRAVELGIAGRPGYFWMGSSSLRRLHTKTYEAGSKLAAAIRGSAVISQASAAYQTGQVSYEAFKREWRERLLKSPEALEYFVSKMPSTVKDFLGEVNFAENFSNSAMMHYDAAIGLALASCITRREKGDKFTPGELYDTFVNTKFKGPVGEVVFDPSTGTRSYKTIVYALHNVVPKELTENGKIAFDLNTTHLYKKGRWVDHEAEFIYHDGTTVAPPSLPPYEHDQHLIHKGVQVFGFVLCGMVVILSFWFLTWTARNRNFGVVKKSQPIFLGMLCVGTMLMGLSIFLHGMQEPTNQSALDKACMAFPWLLSIGFVTAFSALFSKTRRINKIFHSASHSRVKVTARDVLGSFLCLFLANVAILVALTVVSPLKYQREEDGSFDHYGRSLGSYGHCYPTGSSATHVVFLASLLTVNFSVLVYANIEAYQARSIGTEYQESQYIAICMATILEAAIISAPILSVVQKKPTARYLIFSSTIFVGCLAILIPMFLPKVLYLKNYLAKASMRDKKKKERKLRRANLEAMINAEMSGASSRSNLLRQTNQKSGLAIVKYSQGPASAEIEEKLSQTKDEQLVLKAQNNTLKISLDQLRSSVMNEETS